MTGSLNFPNFKGDVRTVGPSEWGNGEIRAHHVWWFNHFPKVAGRKNGIHKTTGGSTLPTKQCESIVTYLGVVSNELTGRSRRLN